MGMTGHVACVEPTVWRSAGVNFLSGCMHLQVFMQWQAAIHCRIGIDVWLVV